MEEYLKLDDEWEEPSEPTKPGQKRVRWADLEEQKQQKKMKAIGFVVGHTDWRRMTDPTFGESALTQTKYIWRSWTVLDSFPFMLYEKKIVSSFRTTIKSLI